MTCARWFVSTINGKLNLRSTSSLHRQQSRQKVHQPVPLGWCKGDIVWKKYLTGAKKKKENINKAILKILDSFQVFRNQTTSCLIFPKLVVLQIPTWIQMWRMKYYEMSTALGCSRLIKWTQNFTNVNYPTRYARIVLILSCFWL